MIASNLSQHVKVPKATEKAYFKIPDVQGNKKSICNTVIYAEEISFISAKMYWKAFCKGLVLIHTSKKWKDWDLIGFPSKWGRRKDGR